MPTLYFAADANAAQGDADAATALLAGYVAAGTVAGVSGANGSFVASAAARVAGVCACNATLPNPLGGEGYAGADCAVLCRRCVVVRQLIAAGSP